METPRRWPKLALSSDHHRLGTAPSSNRLSSKQLKLAYQEHAEAVLRLAQTYVRDLALSEDITHDVFERLWQSNGYDPEKGTMRSYLLIMARSMALNYLNRSNNRRSILKRWQPEFKTESRSGLKMVNRGGDSYLYQRGDLMAVIVDAAGDLQRSGSYLV